MSNETQFAKAYLFATELLLEAIADPTRDTFALAAQAAIKARKAAGDSLDQEGGEGDLAGRLYESIVMASKYHYCSLIY